MQQADFTISCQLTRAVVLEIWKCDTMHAFSVICWTMCSQQFNMPLILLYHFYMLQCIMPSLVYAVVAGSHCDTLHHYHKQMSVYNSANTVQQNRCLIRGKSHLRNIKNTT